MRRREFMTGALLAAFGARASAQTSVAARRLAIFEPAVSAESWRRGFGAVMLAELKRLKYVEGDNLDVEIYGKEQNGSGLEALAQRIVASKPDVVFVGGVGGPLFQRLTDTMPIVVLSSDLIGQGLVKSLAHPDGNITGVAVDTGPAIWGKRIALLLEMAPRSRNVAFLSLQLSQAVRGAMAPDWLRAASEAQGVALIYVPLPFPAVRSRLPRGDRQRFARGRRFAHGLTASPVARVRAVAR